MKRYLLTVGAVLLTALPSLAIDHDNVDAGRPLRFDDADSIGFRERALEYGLSPTWARGSRFRAGISTEYLNGFALNSYYSVDFDATNERLGKTGLGFFHSFRRETLGKPALAVRIDSYLPTGSDADSSRGVDFRVRGILSRTLRGSERIHLNLDAGFRTAPLTGTRAFLPAVTVGYTKPLGYPVRFDRTMLAEVGYRADERGKSILSLGAGLRQQVTPRAVVDVGVQSDVLAQADSSREYLRVNGGYSVSF